jgi:hypothetical protein
MWTRAVYEEFFRQGDAEKEMGLDVSPLSDRDTVAIAESQVLLSCEHGTPSKRRISLSAYIIVPSLVRSRRRHSQENAVVVYLGCVCKYPSFLVVKPKCITTLLTIVPAWPNIFRTA